MCTTELTPPVEAQDQVNHVCMQSQGGPVKQQAGQQHLHLVIAKDSCFLSACPCREPPQDTNTACWHETPLLSSLGTTATSVSFNVVVALITTMSNVDYPGVPHISAGTQE